MGGSGHCLRTVAGAGGDRLMPWRRPRRIEQRQGQERTSPEELLEIASEGEDERDSVELASLDGASIVEAATGEPEREAAAPSITIDAERFADAHLAP